VYKITGNDAVIEKKLVLKNQTGSHFDINFKPRTPQEDSLKLETIFMIDGKEFIIPAHMTFDLKN